jgi:hypothetical protein
MAASARSPQSGDFAVYYGSSPPNGTPQIAFQANTGYLWTYSATAGGTSLGLPHRVE